MDKRSKEDIELAQNAADVYNVYFERSIPSPFWDEIFRGIRASKKSVVGTLQGKDITPKSMAKDIRHKLMKVVAMVKIVGDWQVAGYLAVKFAVLADELDAIDSLKNLPEANKRLKAENEIKRFRNLIKTGEDYQREPDKQYLIFTEGTWKNFNK